ncbi:MAG: zinc-binding dehydrogenase [Gemmatimonadales bacterium]
MKALVMRGHGDLSMLEVADVPEPEVTDGWVKIRLAAAGMNRLDLFTLGGLPGITLEFPHIPGSDGAGVVTEVGSGAQGVEPGDQVIFNPGVSCYECEYCKNGEHSLCVRYRILGEHLPGTFAEYALVPHQNIAKRPHTVSWHEAAAFSLVTITSWRMMVTRADVQADEVVLIWGIGGGVSGTCLQIAKMLGAFVIATSSSDEKLAVARTMGADEVLNHSRVDVAKEVRAITKRRGADVVIDNVGEATWEQSLKALGRAGRLVTCGATTGARVVSDVRRLFWNQYTIMGSTMGNAAEYQKIVELLGQGELVPRVDSVFPLDEGVAAFERLEAGEQMGKVVVQIS